MAIFARHIDKEITPTRWAALAKLYEGGPTSQNLLGRRTAMDGATIKGVGRPADEAHLIETRADPGDGRRRVVALTEKGRLAVEKSLAHASAITRKTLSPLVRRRAGAFSDAIAPAGLTAARGFRAAHFAPIFAHVPHS